MSASDQQLVKIVAEDLRYLRRAWGEGITEDELRRGSPVLRRLMVNGEFARAWRAVGFAKQPSVPAFTLKDIIARIPREQIVFASAGGGRYKGVEIAQSIATIQEGTSHPKTSDPQRETLLLNEFLEAGAVIVRGTLIPRREMIKYVANKLGGAHYDSDRQDAIYQLLEFAAQMTNYLGLNLVYFELLSAGQALAAAEDVSAFLTAVSDSRG